MPISEIGRPKPSRGRLKRPQRGAEHGFTLVELMIVLTILGLMSAAVIIGLPDTRGSLTGEAERFAARANAAHELAIMDARAVSIQISRSGYGFAQRDKREWKPLNAQPFTKYSWDEGTQAAGAGRIIFDSTGSAEPAEVTLVRDDDRVTVSIGHDGRIDVRA